MQPLYNKYSIRLQQISSKASKIQEALQASQEFISVEAHVLERLGDMEKLPQHVQAIMAAWWCIQKQ